jgi:predicted ferric reductase
VDSVHTTADLLTSLGRITGLLGAYLALVQLLLLARLPAMERLYGFDRLTVWHRRNGKACLLLLLAHTVLISVGYAAADRVGLIGEVGRLINQYPGVLPAFVGMALLIAVVVTSLVIVSRRLSFETWYFVHLYTYLGIALGFSHQLATGNEFLRDSVAQGYWYALYLVTLGSLVVFRFATPVYRTLVHRMRVERIDTEAPGVVSITITGRHLDRLKPRAGQFFLWRFLTRDRWWEAHPFSLSALPDGRSLRITVKSLGDFTSRIAAIPVGTRVIAEGPFGSFTAAVRRNRRVAMIAGGVGITPIRALLEELPAAPGELALIYRVVREEDALFLSELRAIAEQRRVSIHLLVGDHREPQGRRLLSPENLRRLIPDLARRDVYLCGPDGMAAATAASLRRVGVPRKQIHVERFAF